MARRRHREPDQEPDGDADDRMRPATPPGVQGSSPVGPGMYGPTPRGWSPGQPLPPGWSYGADSLGYDPSIVRPEDVVQGGSPGGFVPGGGRRRPEPGSRRRRGGHFPGAPGGGMRSMPIPTLGGGFGGVPPEILERAANSVESTRALNPAGRVGGPPSGPIMAQPPGQDPGSGQWRPPMPTEMGPDFQARLRQLIESRGENRGGGPSLNVGPGFAGGGRMGADSRPDISRNPGYDGPKGPPDLQPPMLPPTPMPGMDRAAQLARRQANYDRQMNGTGGGVPVPPMAPPITSLPPMSLPIHPGPMPVTTLPNPTSNGQDPSGVPQAGTPAVPGTGTNRPRPLPIPNPRPGGPPVPNPTGGGGGGTPWDAAPPYTQPTPIADTIPSSTNRPRPLPQSTPPFPSYPPGGGPVTTNRLPMTSSGGVGLPQPPEAQAFQNYLRSKGQ